MKRTIVGAMLLATMLIGDETLADPKADAEQLMNAALPFAVQMLEEHKEFFPFGYAMKKDGEIVSVAAQTGEEHPPSEALIELLKGQFRLRASAGEYKATALLYDVRIVPPGESRKMDAILVALDHRDTYSVQVIFPYTINDVGVVSIGEAFAQEGDGDVFQ